MPLGPERGEDETPGERRVHGAAQGDRAPHTWIDWLELTRSRALLRYGIPVVLVATSLVATRLAFEAFGVRHYFVVLTAILLSSLLGGRAAAVISALLGAAGTAWVFTSFPVAWRLNGLEFATFVFAGLLLGGSGATISGLAVENARLLARARTALARRDDVLAIVSHDLRNPLNAISMSVANALRVAEKGGPEGALRRCLDTAAGAAHRMERLIADLLDAAAIEEGKLSVQPREEDAAAILRDAFVDVRPLAERKGIVLRLEADADLPPVRCDRDRVVQVLENLAANALQATRDGTVTLGGARVSGAVRFEVRDTGPGIGAEELPHLFERYRRGRAVAYRGSGLGLYIARGIVRAHGGELRVESRVGTGSAFSFALPAVPAAPPP